MVKLKLKWGRLAPEVEMDRKNCFDLPCFSLLSLSLSVSLMFLTRLLGFKTIILAVCTIVCREGNSNLICPSAIFLMPLPLLLRQLEKKGNGREYWE